MDAGDLVPDAVTVEMVRARLTDAGRREGFLLDGFPRTISQAESLGEIWPTAARPSTRVVELQVPEDELVARLLARGRSDDTEDVIRRRQQVYRDETSPLLALLPRKLGSPVDATGSVEEITDRVTDALSRTVTRGGVRGLVARWRGRDIELKSPTSSTRCAPPVHWWRGPSPKSPLWRSRA